MGRSGEAKNNAPISKAEVARMRSHFESRGYAHGVETRVLLSLKSSCSLGLEFEFGVYLFHRGLSVRQPTLRQLFLLCLSAIAVVMVPSRLLPTGAASAFVQKVATSSRAVVRPQI